jgi:methylmalonyl-CoA epimerase
MIKGIAHIGIAVRNLETGRSLFQKIFLKKSSEPEYFGELKFSFIPFGNAHVELLESTSAEGVIRKFIDKKGEGVHHISLEVEDIQAEVKEMREKGVQFVSEKPYFNAHQDLVIFIHPKSTPGILVELIQHFKRDQE